MHQNDVYLSFEYFLVLFLEFGLLGSFDKLNFLLTEVPCPKECRTLYYVPTDETQAAFSEFILLIKDFLELIDNLRRDYSGACYLDIDRLYFDVI